MQVDDIEITDKIREAVLDEESEGYLDFTEDDRNTFLWRIFWHLVIGGSMCQYDDDTTQYLAITKSLYKDLVSVKKSEETGELNVTSTVLSLRNSEDMCVFVGDHPQNWMYVTIDAGNRHVNVWYHKWVSHW